MNKRDIANHISGDYFTHLNAEVLAAKKHYSKVQMPLHNTHKNAMGIAHGGAIFSLADMAFAIAANYNETNAILNMNSTVSYLKPGEQGPLIAEGKLIHSGEKVSVFEVTVTDGNNELLALVTITGYRSNLPIY